jgi:type I restriction enzyme R subunit
MMMGNVLPSDPGPDEAIVDSDQDAIENTKKGKRQKVYIDGVGAEIIAERVEYMDEHGKLITESLKDFTRRALRKHYASLDDFLRRWSSAERKRVIVDELAAEGLPLDVIVDELGKDLDPFDLICHVAFDAKPLTRKERAENVKKQNVFGKYGEQARLVLEALLDKYSDEGVLNIDDTNVLTIPPLSTIGTPIELVRAFGGKEGFESATRSLQSSLYEVGG